MAAVSAAQVCASERAERRRVRDTSWTDRAERWGWEWEWVRVWGLEGEGEGGVAGGASCSAATRLM